MGTVGECAEKRETSLLNGRKFGGTCDVLATESPPVPTNRALRLMGPSSPAEGSNEQDKGCVRALWEPMTGGKAREGSKSKWEGGHVGARKRFPASWVLDGPWVSLKPSGERK